MEIKPKIICLTPVKNEAWILEKFLTYTSLWADYIIIADQMSTDGSREIAAKYEKVILVDNTSEAFNEPERQKLLINEARKIEGPRLLITLDADEFFTPNFRTSPEWQSMLSISTGTIVKFRLLEFQPDLKSIREEDYYSWGYLDDGADHSGRKIHSARIPMRKDSDVLYLNDIKVLHVNDAFPLRDMHKQWWYQCYERVTFPHKHSIDIFRMYNRYFDKSLISPMPEEWLSVYKALGLDITSIIIKPYYWWDEQVLNYFDRYGTDFFKHENIWRNDWCETARLLNRENPQKYKTPGGKFYKKLRTAILISQPYRSKWYIKLFDLVLKIFFGY